MIISHRCHSDRYTAFSPSVLFLLLRVVCAVAVVGFFSTGVAHAQNKHPYCELSDSDSDGDGWGWENDKSCVVVGSSADKVVPVISNCPRDHLDTDGDGYGWHNNKSCKFLPTCVSASSDPDGDGYGWENETSCIVRAESKRESGG